MELRVCLFDILLVCETCYMWVLDGAVGWYLLCVQCDVVTTTMCDGDLGEVWVRAQLMTLVCLLAVIGRMRG